MTTAEFTALGALLAALVALPGAAEAEEKAAAGGTGTVPAVAAEAPVRLHLDPAVAEVLRGTMREHLAALQAVVAALGREDYAGAAAVARAELGFQKHHQVMRRERGATYPARYRELAMAHHAAAEDLAGAAGAGDMTPILRALDRTIQACVACHDAYRL